MTAPNLDRPGRSTDVAELVAGADRGDAVRRHHSNIHGAAARRACSGDLSIGDHIHHSAYTAEIDLCGTGETATSDGDAVAAGPGASGREDSGDLRWRRGRLRRRRRWDLRARNTRTGRWGRRATCGSRARNTRTWVRAGRTYRTRYGIRAAA